MIARLCLLLALLAPLAAPALAQEAPAGTAKRAYVHRLLLADRIRVAVFQEDELTTIARVDARGFVNLPLVQEVPVGGLTVAEAQELIQNRYREGRFLRNPQVTVSVEEYAPREVFISGQVRNPGRYLLPNEATFTVVEFVANAGGLTDIARGTAVTVRRTLPDGTVQTFSVDVESIIRGRRDARLEASNILLQPGDAVHVPERLI